MSDRPDIPERLARLETASRYEAEKLDRLEAMLSDRLSSIEQTLASRPRDHGGPSLDGWIIGKWIVAIVMVAVAVALNAIGQHELAAKVMRAAP